MLQAKVSQSDCPFEQQGAVDLSLVRLVILNLVVSSLVVEKFLKKRFRSIICKRFLKLLKCVEGS